MPDNLRFADGVDIAEELDGLSKEAIMHAGQPVIFGRADRRDRSHLLETIASLAVGNQDRIRHVAREHRHKRKRQKTVHLEVGEPETGTEVPRILDGFLSSPVAASGFLKAQSQEVVRRCIANFIDNTGNEALATAVCFVCARECSRVKTEYMRLDSVPNLQLLVPSVIHYAHVLTGGLLLHRKALCLGREGFEGAVCDECMLSLGKKRLPRLALANDMWIGDVPSQLKNLTIPERVLIARYFPAAYIVKLFLRTRAHAHRILVCKATSLLIVWTPMKSRTWCKEMSCLIQSACSLALLGLLL